MIKGLKIKFITLAMASLFLLLTLMITGMNIMSYKSLVQDADVVLTLLSEHRGTFPKNYSNSTKKL